MSVKEIEEDLLAIDKEDISKASKVSKKMQLLKAQVRIRRKVLGQKVPIVFTAIIQLLTVANRCLT